MEPYFILFTEQPKDHADIVSEFVVRCGVWYGFNKVNVDVSSQLLTTMPFINSVKDCQGSEVCTTSATVVDTP